MKDVKMVYVLLDGIGDLPHPSLNDLTPLEAAFTPNLDALARNGAMGRVISVGKGLRRNQILQFSTCSATVSRMEAMLAGA